MTDNKLMYNSNDDTQNNPFCRLQLVVEKFGHSGSNQPNSIKVSKIIKPRKRKRF